MATAGELGYAPASTTTLHVTLLTSHYTPATEEEAVACPSTATAVHRREAPSSTKTTNGGVKSTSSDDEFYGCSTSAEQLDSMARMLCAALRCPCMTTEDAVTRARRVQMAKAVRDNVVSWANFAAAAAAQGSDLNVLYLSMHRPGSAADSLSSPIAASSTVAGSPISPSSGRMGAAQRNTTGRERNSSADKQQRTRSSTTASGPSPRAISVDQEMRQAYLARELPPCELAVVPRGTSSASHSTFVIFVYRLENEDDVLTALTALSTDELNGSDKKDLASTTSGELSESEKREAWAIQASAIITRALWRTIRPVLRAHLHSTSAHQIPVHVPIVWSVTDPRLLSGFLPSVTGGEDNALAPLPCTASPNPSTQLGTEDLPLVERWVRLMPRMALYLYDPACASGTGSTAVQDTLTALQSHLMEEGQWKGHSPKGSRRPRSSDGAKKMTPQSRGGGGRPVALASTKSARPNGSSAATGSSGAGKGRGGRNGGGHVGGASGAVASPVTLVAPHALSASNPGTVRLDMHAAPVDFPYCSADNRSLAYYLYYCKPSLLPAAPTDFGKDLTVFLSKLKAFQSAVLTAQDDIDGPLSAELPSIRMWSSHASLLQWAQAYLSASAVAPSDGSLPLRNGSAEGGMRDEDPRRGRLRQMQLSSSLEDTARSSLFHCTPDPFTWPVPLWEVTSMPLAPLPLMALRRCGSDAADTSTSPLETLPQWAAAFSAAVTKGSPSPSSGTSPAPAPLLLLRSLVHFVDSYNAWSLRNAQFNDISPNCGGEKGLPAAIRPVLAQKARETQPRLPLDSYTGGVFAVISATAALITSVDASLAQQRPLRTLTALCAPAESPAPECTAARTSVGANATAAASTLPSGLFARYAQPFQKLAEAGGNNADSRTPKLSSTTAAIVPRTPHTADASGDDAAPAVATQGQRCSVTTAGSVDGQSESVASPSYPQEIMWAVQSIVASNAGHFELNITRGADSLTPASREVQLPALQELPTAGSLMLATRMSTMATMTIATQSTGLLVQQQKRQKKRPPPAVAQRRQPYSQGAHLIKEMTRRQLGRRQLLEATVLLQKALESTLATAPPLLVAGKIRPRSSSPSSHASSGHNYREAGNVSAFWTQRANAFDMLHRYLVPVNSATCAPSEMDIKKVHPCQPLPPLGFQVSEAESQGEMAAVRAAVEGLMPRVYEHVLQQALLHQLLRETGLEPLPSCSLSRETSTIAHAPDLKANASSQEDWNVTQQIPAEVIVQSIVDFRERFGVHNVVWRSCILDYDSTLIPTVVGCCDAEPKAEREDEVHRTSAYAHNAINVHPPRRVRQLWVVGVPVPQVPSAAVTRGRRVERTNAKALEKNSLSLGQIRSRRWVDMVPREGTVTSAELYALWRSLLLLVPPPRRSHDGTASSSLSASASTEIFAGDSSSLRLNPAHLTASALSQLLSQYMARHGESSTAIVRSESPAEASKGRNPGAPLRFDVHETLYPYGDALVEVWVSEAQRACRYIKATEVTASLHATSREKDESALHLGVRWDDGLLFTCTSRGNGNAEIVLPIDIHLTGLNMVLQRREDETRIRMCRYQNSSANAAAMVAVTLRENNGLSPLGLPQGTMAEACFSLPEEWETLYCVHHCPSELTEAMAVELEASAEREVACDVDESTGVVHRFFASGMQQLLCPSGAIMVRRPLFSVNGAEREKPAPVSDCKFCDTLVTLDGRCFVRNGTCRGAPASAFVFVRPHVAGACAAGVVGVTPNVLSQAPLFTHVKCTYDAVHHCSMRSRQDGVTVVEYESMASSAGAEPGLIDIDTKPILARVAVFSGGITITTLAPRAARERALVRNPQGASVSSSFSSHTLCALLEEVRVFEDNLLGDSADSASVSVRWCIEGSTLPRVYLASVAPKTQEMIKTRRRATAFAVVLGDGTVLQRRWVAAPAASSLPTVSGSTVTLPSVTEDEGCAEDGPSGAVRGAGREYRGGTMETTLIRPSGSAVRVLHSHAIVTVEPADVLTAVTHTSPAAYAVGQGLPFFDLSLGGGMRMVDAARCVWEVRGLADSKGPQVLHPDRTNTYEELLRSLVSTHYSPHRLPRAAQLSYACEQQREAASYALRRADGWCPTLIRRMRELAESFIYTTQLLRTEILAPIETVAAIQDRCVMLGTDTAELSGASSTPALGRRAGVGMSLQCVSRLRSKCFGQLDNGESFQYWHPSEALPASAESATMMPSAASEPHVIQRLVPSLATDSLLGYWSASPAHRLGIGSVGLVLCGDSLASSGEGSILWQRISSRGRLSLLFSGAFAPSIPPAIRPARSTELSTSEIEVHASTLPPLTVLLHHGSRWLPSKLQPPQQFGARQTSRTALGDHTEGESADVVWVHDATKTLSSKAADTAYVHYVLDDIGPAPSKAFQVALQRGVVRSELCRHEQLAQLSHYHRVLSSQWPMELPASAQESQVRLELRLEELLRGSGQGTQLQGRKGLTASRSRDC